MTVQWAQLVVLSRCSPAVLKKGGGVVASMLESCFRYEVNVLLCRRTGPVLGFIRGYLGLLTSWEHMPGVGFDAVEGLSVVV